MIKFGKGVVKFRIPILILAVLLLIPAGISYLNTRVNYDILSYLPSDIETMKGQDILLDEFGTGAFSFLIVEGMDDKDVDALADEIDSIDHVKDVYTIFSITRMQTASLWRCSTMIPWHQTGQWQQSTR